jgi:hypothetical protein
MAKERLTHRLPQPRVSEKLFHLVHKVAVAQELDVADVIRLALEDYCAPNPKTVNVQVVGKIKDNHVVFYPWMRINTELSQEDRARYLEVEPVGGGV